MNTNRLKSLTVAALAGYTLHGCSSLDDAKPGRCVAKNAGSNGKCEGLNFEDCDKQSDECSWDNLAKAEKEAQQDSQEQKAPVLSSQEHKSESKEAQQDSQEQKAPVLSSQEHKSESAKVQKSQSFLRQIRPVTQPQDNPPVPAIAAVHDSQIHSSETSKEIREPVSESDETLLDELDVVNASSVNYDAKDVDKSTVQEGGKDLDRKDNQTSEDGGWSKLHIFAATCVGVLLAYLLYKLYVGVSGIFGGNTSNGETPEVSGLSVMDAFKTPVAFFQRLIPGKAKVDAGHASNESANDPSKESLGTTFYQKFTNITSWFSGGKNGSETESKVETAAEEKAELNSTDKVELTDEDPTRTSSS